MLDAVHGRPIRETWEIMFPLRILLKNEKFYSAIELKNVQL
jgi:hypothetical protein